MVSWALQCILSKGKQRHIASNSCKEESGIDNEYLMHLPLVAEVEVRPSPGDVALTGQKQSLCDINFGGIVWELVKGKVLIVGPLRGDKVYMEIGEGACFAGIVVEEALHLGCGGIFAEVLCWLMAIVVNGNGRFTSTSMHSLLQAWSGGSSDF